MKRNILLLAFTLLFFCNLSAQVLYNEDFEDFTLGNVTTSSDGQTAGQGGWFFSTNYTLNQSVAFENLCQIQNDPSKGKVITMLPYFVYPYSIGGSTSINNNLNTVITNRTLGNDVLRLEIDFYTGPQSNSLNDIYFGLGKIHVMRVVGFTFDSDTGELRGTYHDATTTPFPSVMRFSLNENNQSLIVPFNSWIRCVVYADYKNNKVVYEIPSLDISVEKDFLVNEPYPISITNNLPNAFIAYTHYNDATSNGLLPTYKFDNIKVTALNQVLSTNEVLTSQFNLYPNPVTDLVTITNQDNISVRQIKIYDLAGKLIYIQNFENKAEIQLNVEKLTIGTYLLHLQTNQGTAVKKLIKK